MHTRSSAIALATVTIAAIAAAPAAAQTEPHSESGATAVVIDGVAAVSQTTASTEGDGSAEASVLKLGGETVVGGSQEGGGENKGEILTTGEDNENGFLTVGSWRATVAGNESDSRTAVVDGNLGGEGGASATVLESESRARSGESEAETTGVRLQLGEDLTIELLRATTSSSGEGESYILSINDEKILTSEQADGQCEIPADPLLHLLCLYAEATEGEDGTTETVAGVVDVKALDENLTGRAFDTRASAAPAAEVGGEQIDRAPAGEEDEDGAPIGSLPRTGGGLTGVLLGLLTMGSGAALRRFGR